MPNRIDKLTPKEEKAMVAYRDKWIEQGLKTGETDWKTFDKFMPICYKKAGIEYPKNVVRVQSPLVGALASAVAEAILRKKYGAVDGAVRDAVGHAVGDAVRDAVRDAVGHAVRGAVGHAVRDAVGHAVGDAVRGAVDDAVRGAVRGAVDDAVRDAVGDAVGGDVRGAVGHAVGDAVSDAVGGDVDAAIKIAKTAEVTFSWHYWLGGQFWVGGWYLGVAFVNFFFDICKLKLSKDIMERTLAYRKVCESVNYIWPNRNFVMVCARPVRISRDEQGRLHSLTEQAIEYPDGWGLYVIHGVKFTTEQFEKQKTADISDIISWEDIDQRSALLQDRPIETLLETVPKKLIDKTEECGGYELYELELDKIGKAKVMVYKSWSLEKMYVKFVPPESEKCLETVASLRSQSVEELLNSYKS
jgi:hypothetical protein